MKLILEFIEPLLFYMCSVPDHVESYVETIHNEHSLLVFDQGGIVALQDGLVAYLPQNKAIRDMNREKVGCTSSSEHSNVSVGFFEVPVANFGYHLLYRHRNPMALFSKNEEVNLG
jgi:hypothetical protein